MKTRKRMKFDFRAAAEVLFMAGAGFCAGMVNGLLGTGGGILLLPVLRRHANTRDAFASALFCILPLSVLSCFLYAKSGTLSAAVVSDALQYLLGALPGGMLGAYLLNRLDPRILQLIFAALLLFSGWRMAFA
ncbi:MAG: sulfite exporter TauE/SafE family protein [Clostridia bacterium]|nr:sulfite exporter TauE/SafE family protein [Clostridia bacterium]